MALPKITQFSIKTTLPVCGEEVRVFAYNVSELKNLFIAKGDERDDLGDEQVEDALVELLQNKIPDVNIQDLTMTDIIAAYIHMLSISSGTTNEQHYRCKMEYDGVSCDSLIHSQIDLAEYKVQGENKNHSMINVGDGISIEVVYPTYRMLRKLRPYIGNHYDYERRMLALCIEAVYDGEDVTTDFSEEEISEWCKELPVKVLHEFDKFLSTIPVLYKEWEIVCPKCGSASTMRISNLVDFFTQGSQTRTS